MCHASPPQRLLGVGSTRPPAYRCSAQPSIAIARTQCGPNMLAPATRPYGGHARPPTEIALFPATSCTSRAACCRAFHLLEERRRPEEVTSHNQS